MKKLTLLFALLASISSAFAGSAASEINCISKSGKTKFYSVSQDMDTRLEEATLSIEGKEFAFKEGRILYAYEDGVITVNAYNEQQNTEVRFWSIPSSVQTKSNTSSQIQVAFDAKILGTDPRKYETSVYGPEWTSIIEVRCTLNYEI